MVKLSRAGRELNRLRTGVTPADGRACAGAALCRPWPCDDHGEADSRCAGATGLVPAGAGRPRNRLQNRLERGLVDSRTSTLAAVHRALVKGGVEFIPADVKGEGVRLSLPAKDE